MPEGFLAYHKHMCLRKFFGKDEKDVKSGRLFRGTMYVHFPGQLIENIDEGKILVLPYMSSNNELKLSQIFLTS